MKGPNLTKRFRPLYPMVKILLVCDFLIGTPKKFAIYRLIINLRIYVAE